MTEAYIALGSNLDDPVDQLQRARARIARLPGVVLRACSSLYRTAPLGYHDQPGFINAVCALETQLSPQELLAHLQAVESHHGRKRSNEQNGPRTLDLDILLYGDQMITTPSLEIPHPRMLERAFVIVPLLEIAPDLQIPGQAAERKKRPLEWYLPGVSDQEIEKLDIPWSD